MGVMLWRVGAAAVRVQLPRTRFALADRPREPEIGDDGEVIARPHPVDIVTRAPDLAARAYGR